jgi:chemotaxis signal transduction protein
VVDAAGGDQRLAHYLVVAETALMELAFLVDDVLAVEPLPANRIQETTNMIRGIRAEYVRGVVERPVRSENSQAGLLIVLDLPAVLSDPRLVVNQETI